MLTTVRPKGLVEVWSTFNGCNGILTFLNSTSRHATALQPFNIFCNLHMSGILLSSIRLFRFRHCGFQLFWIHPYSNLLAFIWPSQNQSSCIQPSSIRLSWIQSTFWHSTFSNPISIHSTFLHYLRPYSFQLSCIRPFHNQLSCGCPFFIRPLQPDLKNC